MKEVRLEEGGLMMAGNILYIPYTIFIVLSIIVLTFILYRIKGSTPTKRFLSVVLPLFLLIQIYFWNLGFNHLIKSYLFPNDTYHCGYGEDIQSFSIRLPERSVFKFKEDGCSNFYTTYIDDHKFRSFYKQELDRLENKGDVESYNYFEVQDNGTLKYGYAVELSSSKTTLDIFFYRVDDHGTLFIQSQ